MCAWSSLYGVEVKLKIADFDTGVQDKRWAVAKQARPAYSSARDLPLGNGLRQRHFRNRFVAMGNIVQHDLIFNCGCCLIAEQERCLVRAEQVTEKNRIVDSHSNIAQPQPFSSLCSADHGWPSSAFGERGCRESLMNQYWRR